MRRLSNDVCTIIAEAGVNHDGDVSKALKLVDVAAEAGADFVKFQMFRADALAAPDAPKAAYQSRALGASKSGQRDMLQALELSSEAFQRIIDQCEAANIGFLCTPFDPESLRALVEDFSQSLLKFGSGDLTNAPLLHNAAQRGCDVVLSTGMADLKDVVDALGVLAHGFGGGGPPGRDAFEASWADPTLRARVIDKAALLHCTSQYPAAPEDVNLAAMATLQGAFDMRVGYSDHTLGDLVPIAAIAAGATILEKHITLDRASIGPDHSASMEPGDFASLVAKIRTLEAAMGDGVKAPKPVEADVAAVARKSLVALCDISEGERFTVNNLGVKRPAGGLSPMRYWELLGKSSHRAYGADAQIDADAL